MNSSVFDKDTILDLTVNIVPLVILGFFIVLYLILNPWGFDDILVSVISHGLMIFTFLNLLLLTYVAALFIERDEDEVLEKVDEH